MKPGEHPEFFRLPPPPGASRESTIRLDREGRFWHDGAPITHPGMQLAFASWIDRHPDDGRFVLNNGYDWSYFVVEDVPFFVRTLRASERSVVIGLSDGSEEELDPSSLHLGPSGAVYVRVKSGRFEARFMPEAQTALMPLLVEDEAGALVLEVCGKRYRIPGRDGS